MSSGSYALMGLSSATAGIVNLGSQGDVINNEGGNFVNIERGDAVNIERGDAINNEGRNFVSIERGDAFFVNIERGDAVNIERGDAVNIERGDAVNIERGVAVNIERGDAVNIEGGDAVNIEGGDAVNIEGGDAVNIERGDAVNIEGGDAVNNEGGNFVHIERGDAINNEGGNFVNIERDDAVNIERGEAINNEGGNFVNIECCDLIMKLRGRGGLTCVLIAGALVVGALIASVLILRHTKSSHDGKVPVGASLLATADHKRSWPSPSGVFAFGFRQLVENNDQFLLCIWYDNIPDKTIVWWANGDRLAPKGSTFKLTARGLVLTSPGGENLWDQTITGVVAHGVMNDTGNFVLEDDKSKSLWETFKNPTDTMLPGQIIERGGKLSSRQSETNYTRGRFQLDFQQEDGNLVLKSDKKPICSTRTTTGNVSDSEGKQWVFDDSGILYILRKNGGKVNFTAEECPAKAYYLRSTLNFDGVLVQYFLPKSLVGNAGWKALRSEPNVFFGDNSSFCNLNADPRSTYECPRG